MLVMLIVVSEIIYQWQVWQAGDTKWKSKWGKRSPIMQLVGLQGTGDTLSLGALTPPPLSFPIDGLDCGWRGMGMRSWGRGDQKE